jgi:hypothetical protein
MNRSVMFAASNGGSGVEFPKTIAKALAAKKAGKSAADAATTINLTAKYPDYKSERVKAAIDAIYAEIP